MDADRVTSLIDDLSSSDENVRLKAANTFVNAQGDEARRAIPRLKEILHTEPNPAVKFLAKKALSNLGEKPDQEEAEKSSRSLPASEIPGTYRILKDGRILHKVALNVLEKEIQTLLGSLHSRDPELQRRLTEAVLQLGSDFIAGPLIQAHLASETMEVKAGEISAPDAAEMLLGGDIEHAVHADQLRKSRIDPAMAAAMGNLEVPEVFAVLVDMLGEESPVLANGALSILSGLKDPKVLGPLLSSLGSRDQEYDERIMEHVRNVLGEDTALREKTLEGLLTNLRRPGNGVANRLATVHALGGFAETKALDPLRECLHADEPEIRAEAIWALSRYDLPESWLVSNVRPSLQDPAPLPVAFAAVALLGGSGSSHAVAAAQKLVESPEAEARLALARALERATSAEASPFLERLLRDPELGVREAAVVATRCIQVPEVVEFLGNLLTEEDEQVAIAAIETVGRLEMDQYNDLLGILVDQAESPRVRATMIMCMGRMGIVDNLPAVAYYLTDEDPRVRANAVEALEHLRDPKSTSLVHLSLNDPHPRVVSNAIKALWGWGELRVQRRLGELLEGRPEERLAGVHALGEMVMRSRVEVQLVDSPMLVTALRQQPRYQELRRMYVQ